MTTINKINNLIEDNYTIEISSYTEVYLDSYEEGELDLRNHWQNEKMTFNTDSKTLEADIQVNIEEYIENVLFATYNKTYVIDSLKNVIDDNSFWYNNFVDVENTTPDEAQIEEWKKGEIELFTQYIRITTSINGVEIPADIMLEIMEK